MTPCMAFLIGFFLGGIIGFVAVSIFTAGRNADQIYEDKKER